VSPTNKTLDKNYEMELAQLNAVHINSVTGEPWDKAAYNIALEVLERKYKNKVWKANPLSGQVLNPADIVAERKGSRN